MTTLHVRRAFAELMRGRAVSALIVLLILITTTMPLVAARTMSGGTLESAAPTIGAPAPREVTCWDSPDC